MRREVEALGPLADVASEIEIGLAELAEGLEGEAKDRVLRLRDTADRLADSLTAVYLELAKSEAARGQAPPTESGAAES